jgi:transcriptional regulator with XRE-family HTH domain
MTKTNGNTLGSRIRSARQRRKMSLRTLAHEADIDPGNLSRVENNARGLRNDSLRKVAKALGVSQRSLRGEG